MRAPIVIAASLAGLIAGAAAARAADLPVAPYGYGGCCNLAYAPIPPLVIIDDEPGVVVRCWWEPPWRNRHYYPHGRASLKTGRRHEAERRRPHAVPRYSRYWTNPPVYVLDAPPPYRHRHPAPTVVGP